ncbi:alpha-D-glucose phosphate-specific phosphoglucomutase [bacterium]|nr:alpha-D-glucose phosphate-specific phosphoglucomutase [bacterium]MCI0603347.1 alpha-D-glucose phosphate-specific phosphoglucomutase [bacterium]
MTIKTIQTKPFQDQRPGTSGLRKKTRIFMQEHYLENFVQAVFNAVKADADPPAQTLVVGGDGRYYNRSAVQIILRMASANGWGRVLVGRSGILSTPAMSAVIRRRKALGGLVLSASHNPGGIDEDFGIKYNIANGGPAPEKLTERIYQETLRIQEYFTVDHTDVDLDREAEHHVGGTGILIIDSLSDYTAVMEELFDFGSLRKLFESGFRMAFDAMNGVTGPYAVHILEEIAGAPQGTVLRGTPLEDFGGHHPDPNLVYAAELVQLMSSSSAPDFGAACDGDGDRNMILGKNFFVTPGDSLAILAEHATKIPGYSGGLAGVARSMPTSMAVDRVAKELGVPAYETPTGWKFFGNLMDAGMCTLCGEESFGTGSNHVREKDGLWAVLAWLSVLASVQRPVSEIVTDHWKRFGRSYYQRHDHEKLNAGAASEMISNIRQRLLLLEGTDFAGSKIVLADDFQYVDPVDGSISKNQGIRILLDDSSRIVCRLSGTGTEGATLRIYLERYLKDGGVRDISEVLSALKAEATKLLELVRYFGTDVPDVIT